MSTYDIPISANRLVELPLVFKYLDKRYGTQDIKEPKKKNGEYAIRFILKHLSYNRNSTCKEIAEAEHEKYIHSKKQPKLKSITDDVRKFVYDNLIPSELVYEDEPKIEGNKHVKTYSLSPIGILYSMYLLGNFRKTDEFGMPGYDLLKIDRNLIKSLGKEYSETLPKVFGRFELFEKILGKDFVSFLIIPFTAIYDLERADIPHERFLLTDHILTSYEFLFAPRFNTQMDVHKFIAEQISLIFYVHLEEALIYPLREKIDEDSNFRNKNGTAKYRESLNQAREMWIQIMNEDRELKKWYDIFLKDATKAKRDEYGVVSHYQKKVYSHWNFPS